MGRGFKIGLLLFALHSPESRIHSLIWGMPVKIGILRKIASFTRRRWSVLTIAVVTLTLFSASVPPSAMAEQVQTDYRQAEVGLMGGTELLLDTDSHGMVGQPWGGGFYVKFFPLHHLSIQFDAGYYVTYKSQTVSLPGLVSYKEVSALGTAPILLGINYEIRPNKIFNPFVGIAGGIFYTMVSQTAQNISNLHQNPGDAGSLTSNDLMIQASKTLYAAVARVGLDIRPIPFFTVMVWAQYAYTFDHLELVNDRIGTKKPFKMDNVGINLGLGFTF